VLLDFYRLPGEAALRQLKLLEKHRASLILGDQARMEFMNNRQRAILAGMQSMTRPHRPTFPSVLLDAKAAKTLVKKHGALRTQARLSSDTPKKMFFEIDGRLEVSQEISIPVMARCNPRRAFAGSPRCGARTRHQKLCQAPMPNGRCRMHRRTFPRRIEGK
jgi:hypothetical protein